MNFFDLARERRRAAWRALLLLALFGGWAAYGRGPIAFSVDWAKTAVSRPAPTRSRTSVSWLNGGKPLEDIRR